MWFRRRPESQARFEPQRAALLALAALVASGAGHADVGSQRAADSRYEKTTDEKGDYRISAGFTGFDGGWLNITFPLAQAAVRQSMAEFGETGNEINELARSCNGPCPWNVYESKLAQHYRESNIRPVPAPDGVWHLYPDVPALVAHNRQRVRALAVKLDQFAAVNRYDAEETLGVLIAFVQKALAYSNPPKSENGREIFGFYPPPRALEAGLGDCDTKSALLAAVVTNFPGVKVVGVHVPKHYLVGIARIPRSGDAYIEYEGEPYVLIEPSGPARMPLGTIAESTRNKLDATLDVRVERLF